MVEVLDETQALESTTVGIYRTATVVKGGRRFSWSAMVVVGDRHGSVGIGYAKATGVPAAIEKAQKEAKRRLTRVTLLEGTIPHTVTGKFGASAVRLIPAAPGTGVIAGGTVRAVLEMAGVRDCLTKSFGSTNQKNLCKAALQGLLALRTKQQVAEIRGVDLPDTVVEEILSASEISSLGAAVKSSPAAGSSGDEQAPTATAVVSETKPAQEAAASESGSSESSDSGGDAGGAN